MLTSGIAQIAFVGMKKVFETPPYLATLPPLSERVRAEIIHAMTVDPEAGQLLAGVDGTRETLFSTERGEVVVISIYLPEQRSVYLLAALDPAELATLSTLDRRYLAKLKQEVLASLQPVPMLRLVR